MNNAYDLRDLRQVYTGATVLQLDEYSIHGGGVTALVGPNGSGKSTLLDLLAFIRPPASGSIHYFGSAVRADRHMELRREIGYVQQKPYLFNLTVEQNIELGLKLRKLPRQLRRQRTVEITRKFGLEPLAHRRAHDLSGGEIQRVALARAMVMQPRVLILDEPFSHLDRTFRADLERVLREARSGGDQTIIFSTHDQIQAQMLADEVCVLIDGHRVRSLVVNLFRGVVDGAANIFDTGNIRIHIPSAYQTGGRLAIESTSLVLSRHELESSMRNHFTGKIRSLTQESGNIHVTVECGELFHVLITPGAWRELGITIGDNVWVSFKSTAVNIF